MTWLNDVEKTTLYVEYNHGIYLLIIVFKRKQIYTICHITIDNICIRNNVLRTSFYKKNIFDFHY